MGKKYGHLYVPGHWERYWSKYPEGYTILESLMDWVSQVDQMVDSFNTLDDRVEEVHDRLEDFLKQFKGNLYKEVKELLEMWDREGILEIIITEALDNKITETLEEVKKITQNDNNPRPSFVFIDDDGKAEVRSVLKPILDEYNIKATIAIITDRLGQERYLDDGDVIDLHNAGHDIVSHSKTHPDFRTLTDAQLRTELEDSKIYLEALGIPQKHIMYPYGRTNDRVLSTIREYYESGCGTAPGINPHPIMTYQLRRVGVGVYGPTPYKLETYKKYVDETIRLGGMCLFMTHIEETPPDNIELIGEIINYVRSKGYDFETYSEAYEKHKNIIEQGAFTPSYVEKFNVVGASGEQWSKDLAVYTSGYDEYDVNSVPDDFRTRTKTITQIRDPNSSGFPLNRGGILTTYKLSTDNVFTQQTYEPRNSGKDYVRYWVDGAWTDFIGRADYEIVPSNSMTFSDSPSKYPPFKTSATFLSDANASGFPEGKGGTLTTYRLTGDDSGTYQQYQIRQEYTSYIRVWNGNNWSSFRPTSFMMNLPVDSRNEKSKAADFPLHCVSVVRVRQNNADGLPNNKGGVLTTYRLDGDDDFTYQIYKDYNVNRVYVRTWKPSDGEFNEFTLIGGVGA